MNVPLNTAGDAPGDAAHRATQEALPWLLNGTLAGAELDAAQAHLRDCALCQADLTKLRHLREGARTPDPQCDPERALARLMGRIDTRENPVENPGVDTPELQPVRPRAANDPRWLRRVALAQCGVIVLLAALLAWSVGDQETYRGLGAAPAPQGEIVVLFRPDTPEYELRRIVRAGGARIVAGPTVTDAWVLAIPQGQSAAVLARLRAEPAVLLAEPLAGERSP